MADTLNSMDQIELSVLATESLYHQYLKGFGHVTDETQRNRQIIEQINLAALTRVREFQPDVVLVMALSPISPWFIDNAKQSGAVTAHWYVENFRYYPSSPLIPRWQTVAPCYDYFFTFQKDEFFKALKTVGAKNHYYVPTACNPKIHRKIRAPIDQSLRSNISFVGHPYENRISLFKQLNEFDIALWGPGWSRIPELKLCAKGNGQLVSSSDDAKIMNHTQIGLNIHSSLHPEILIHRGDSLNPRVFTLASCGTFQLVDDQEPLGEAFDCEKEVAVYHDLATLKAQLKRFLENPGEREKMAKCAMQRAQDEHTYGNRIQRMLDIVGMA
jgi:spore maturation protein CgeB